MQVFMKIIKNKRKTKAGLKQLFNYIARDKAVYKTGGIGVVDNKDIAFKQMLINKQDWKKNNDNKDRFCYHEILSFPSGTNKELIVKITEEYCNNFYNKGFNSWYGIHKNTDNPHTHIIIDNVSFLDGKKLVSLTEKQATTQIERTKKNEVFVYEKQRETFEDICIKNGIEIAKNERYKAMHKQKKIEKRIWLNREQYRAFKNEKSWRNEILNTLEEIYKRNDVTKENIVEIAEEYNLGISRHNKKKGTITFCIIDKNGELDKNKRIKLEKLREQEQGRFKDVESNIFLYSNFFRDRTKEIENQKELENIFEAGRQRELEKRLELMMKERENLIKDIEESLIKSRVNELNIAKEKDKEAKKQLEIAKEEIKEDEKTLIKLEKDLEDMEKSIPVLENDIEKYNNNIVELKATLPDIEKDVNDKTIIADTKKAEVERLQKLLEQAQSEYNTAEMDKTNAIENKEIALNRINNNEELLKSTTTKIVTNKEKIKTRPVEISNKKNEIEVKKDNLQNIEKEVEKTSENVIAREQVFKKGAKQELEKVLEYESFMMNYYEQLAEAEEQHKQEVSERYKKEIKEFQQSLINMNIEYNKINEMNRRIAEEVAIKRELKKKAEQDRLWQEQLNRNLQAFKDYYMYTVDLIQFAEGIEELKEIEPQPYEYTDEKSYKELYNKYIGSYIKVADITKNQEFLERITKFVDTQKEIEKGEEIEKTVTSVEIKVEKKTPAQNEKEFDL